jgi:hypothetical protein
MAKWCCDFDRNRHSERFYRVLNEVPTGLMIGIVLLAVASRSNFANTDLTTRNGCAIVIHKFRA